MKKKSLLALITTSLALAVSVISFSDSSFDTSSNDVSETFAADDPNTNWGGMKAQPFGDRYTSTWTSEPLWSSENTKHFTPMNVSDVWKNYQGDENGTEPIKVAVIDSGINIYHEDFLTADAKNVNITASNVANYSILDPKSCYIHDTSNGYYKNSVVTEVGIDKAYDTDTYDKEYNEYYSHGTASAACIGAAINGVGGLGIAPKCKLLIIRMDFYFTSLDVAIRYAADNGAKVINMSLGAYAEDFTDGYGDAQTGSSSTATALTSAINYALNKDCVVVAAAGNEKTNHKSYPACNAGVIGVGALGKTNITTTAADFSNFNLDSDTSSTNNNVDVMAPGYVYTANMNPSSGPRTGSNLKDSSYQETQGTSFASPLTAGAVALARSKYPTLSHTEIEKLLTSTCADIGTTGWDKKFGFGRVDVKNLLGVSTDVEEVTLSESSITMYTNSTDVKLSADVLPSTATNRLIHWSSTNSSVVSVPSTSNAGVEIALTPKSAGSTTITAISDFNSSIFATCSVTVKQYVPVTSFSIADINGHKSSTITRGETIQLVPSISPSNASKQEVIYLPNDETIVSVDDETGIVKGLKPGTTTITAICGDEMLEDTYSITVEASQSGGYFTINLYDSATLDETGSTNCWSLDNLKTNNRLCLNGTAVTNNSVVTALDQDKAYKRIGGASLGSSKNTGNIKFTINDDYKVTKVTIVGTSWNGTSATSGGLKLNDVVGTGKINPSKTALASCTETLVWENLDNLTSLNFTPESYRNCIYTIECEYASSSPTPPTPVTNYTVTFNANGGTGSMSNATTNGSSYVTPSCGFTRSGYHFDGWALNSTSGTKYAIGSTISSISNNITLYAIWVKDSGGTIVGDFYPNHDADTYYANISDSDSGTTLLSSLRTLNSSKRKKTIGYNSMGTSPSGYFKYTDYDPNFVTYDENNQPVGSKLISFYSGKSSVDGLNREHVWPNSHAGDKVEDDIHMPRPTLTAENGSRGNSFYVEGMKDPANGWDPAMESFGLESYRGDSARIVFYCMVAESSFQLIDANKSAGGDDGKMGKLSDLLKWNLNYPVLQREQNRNEGAEYVQGNRNPFIDHPEYACKIWGNTNDETRKICSSTPIGDKTLFSLTLTGTPTKTSYYSNESFSPDGLTITATFDDESTQNVTNEVTWTPSPLTTGTTSVTGSYTFGEVTKTVIVSGLTVTASSTDNLSLVTSMNSLSDGDLVYLAIGLDDDSVGVTGQNGDKDATVSTSKSKWKQYTVVKSGTKYMLKDGSSYIAEVNGNEFKYGTTGASITLDNSNNVKVGSRWFVKNGGNYRCYTSLGNYVPFHLYKVITGPQVNSISLDPTSLTFDLYNDFSQKSITASVSADEGADTTVSWSVADSSVVSISSQTGTTISVSCLKKGNTSITARAGKKEATCTVTVGDSTPILVKSISISSAPDVIETGKTGTMTVSINPSNATNKALSWTSSDSSILSVSNGTGLTNTISAVGNVGEKATITVSSIDGSDKSVSKEITIIEQITIKDYKLYSSVSSVPFMEGKGTTTISGRLYKVYSNNTEEFITEVAGISVDTTKLGQQNISCTYNGNNYVGSVKVVNSGADIGTHGGTEQIDKDYSVNCSPSVWSGYITDDGTTNKGISFTSADKTKSILLYRTHLNCNEVGTYQFHKSTSGSLLTKTSIGKIKSISFVGEGDTFIVKVGHSPESCNVTLTSTKVLSNQALPQASNTYNYTVTGDYEYALITRSSPSAVSKISNLSIVETASETVQKDHNADYTEQAKAWASYFKGLTRTDSTCLASNDEDKLTGLKAVWEELKTEYNAMNDSSKDAFFSESDLSDIREHYRFIISKFGKNSKYGDNGLEDFVVNSASTKLTSLSNNRNKLFNFSDTPENIILISSFVAISVVSLGLYFAIRKKKEI